MSKFCNKCGASFDDDALFCPVCGAPVEAPVEAPVAEEAAPEKRTVSFEVPDVKAIAGKMGKDKIVKIGIIAGAALTGLIVLIVALSLIFPSPKAVVKKYMRGMINGNAKAVVSTMPPFMFEDKDDKEDAIEMYEEVLDYIEMDDVKYEIKDVSKMSSSDKKDLKKALENYEDINDDFDADKVKGFKVVEVKVKDGDEKKTVEFSLIKYKGRWYIMDSDL